MPTTPRYHINYLGPAEAQTLQFQEMCTGVVLTSVVFRPAPQTDCSQILIHTVGADVVKGVGRRRMPLEPVKSTPPANTSQWVLFKGKAGASSLDTQETCMTADTNTHPWAPLLGFANKAVWVFSRQLNNYI